MHPKYLDTVANVTWNDDTTLWVPGKNVPLSNIWYVRVVGSHGYSEPFAVVVVSICAFNLWIKALSGVEEGHRRGEY